MFQYDSMMKLLASMLQQLYILVSFDESSSKVDKIRYLEINTTVVETLQPSRKEISDFESTSIQNSDQMRIETILIQLDHFFR